jgi:hypothetical protein
MEATRAGKAFGLVELGSTDELGLVSDTVSPELTLRVAAYGAAFPLARSELVAPPAGGAWETTLHVASGDLVLAFPDDVHPPRPRSYEVTLTREQDGVTETERWLRRHGLIFGGPRPDRRHAFGAVAPGRYVLRLTGWHAEDGTVRPPIEVAVEIAAGETTVFEVPGP